MGKDIDEAVLKFLVEQFPTITPMELEYNFGWIFETKNYEPSLDAKQRKERIKSKTYTIRDFKKLVGQGNFAGHATNLKALPKSSAEEILKSKVLGEIDFEVALKILEESQKETEIWFKNNPIQGGLDTQVDRIADDLRYAFDKLNIHAGYGNVVDSKGPSTKFGKTVQFALKYHNIDKDWRSPTRKHSKKNP